MIFSSQIVLNYFQEARIWWWWLVMDYITLQLVMCDYHGGGGYLLVMDYITLQLVMHNITLQVVMGDYHGVGDYLLVMGDYHHRPI